MCKIKITLLIGNYSSKLLQKNLIVVCSAMWRKQYDAQISVNIRTANRKKLEELPDDVCCEPFSANLQMVPINGEKV